MPRKTEFQRANNALKRDLRYECERNKKPEKSKETINKKIKVLAVNGELIKLIEN